MKILILLESTQNNDNFLYMKALADALAADGYEPKIVFTTAGCPADHTYQLVKDHVVHHLTKLCFTSGDAGYAERLANHIARYEYDFLVVTKNDYGFLVSDVYDKIDGSQPRLVFFGSECCRGVTRAAEELADCDPIWVANSEMVAKHSLAKYDVQIINGPAVQPEDTGADIRAEFGIPKHIKVLGYWGNVDIVKWDEVLEAARRMKCLVLVAGTGDRIETLAQTKFVKVVPATPHCRGDWYRAVDCFIYPVSMSGFPMLVLEAALCNCPVAMTPVSDMYKVCRDEFGFFDYKPEKIIGAVAAACRLDRDAVRESIAAKFSGSKFLSDWQILLS